MKATQSQYYQYWLKTLSTISILCFLCCSGVVVRPVVASQVVQVVSTTTDTIESTSPLDDKAKARHAAYIVGVRPQTYAPRFLKRLAGRFEKRFLSFISWCDPSRPPDSKLSLRILWWKALIANDQTSPIQDSSLSYDLLPSGFRLLIHPSLARFYPRWIHTMIEIRTAYLYSALANLVAHIRSNSTSSAVRIRLVTLGGGYDIKSMYLRHLVEEAVELDLPHVIAAKQAMLTSPRFRRRQMLHRTNNCSHILPTFYAVDLNDLDAVREALNEIVAPKNDESSTGEKENYSYWHTIFVFEGVLIYLDPGMPTELLRLCGQVLRTNSCHGSLCFADTLEGIPDDEEETARHVLRKLGWNLTDWLPKGGRTRHMGTASSASSSSTSLL